MAQGMHFGISERAQDTTSPFHFCVRYPGTSSLSDWHVFKGELMEVIAVKTPE